MTRLKICGFTGISDVETAADLGVDYAGFIFVPGSPRMVSRSAAISLVAACGPMIPIALFAGAETGEIVETVKACGFLGVQLHGEEPPDFCVRLRRMLADIIIIKTFRPERPEEMERLAEYSVDFFLFDSAGPGSQGGTGRTIAPDLLGKALDAAPRSFVAGGITIANAAETIKRFHPFALDTASGVESAPGRKDRALMRRLVATVKNNESS